MTIIGNVFMTILLIGIVFIGILFISTPMWIVHLTPISVLVISFSLIGVEFMTKFASKVAAVRSRTATTVEKRSTRQSSAVSKGGVRPST